jgi:hypothetical protein
MERRGKLNVVVRVRSLCGKESAVERVVQTEYVVGGPHEG